MNSPEKNTDKSNKQWIQDIRAGDKDAFKKLFRCHYHDLCSLAFKITKCSEQARDVVQDVFLKLWNKRERWQVETSLKAYLYQAVWNQALNYKNQKDNRRKLQQEFSKIRDHALTTQVNGADNQTQRLITEIWNIVDTMADRRQFVFILHRKHGLSYKEIAGVMDISRKTVENHMGLALQEIRDTVNPDLLRVLQ